MSNYTVTTNFAAKDSLPSGNPTKLILGAQLTTEFANIATAITSKLDGVSIAGTANQITASASAGVITLSLPANIIIPPTGAGNTVSATASAAGSVYVGTGGGASSPVFLATSAAATALSMISMSQTGQTSWQLYQPASSNDIRFNAGGTDRFIITSAGLVNIPAPASTINAVGGFALNVSAPNSANNSFGQIITAGTSSADFAFRVLNAAINTNYFQIFGDGGVLLAAATGGDQGLGTLNASGLFVNGATVLTSAAAGTLASLLVGAATGGNQGAGTINATGLFINGVAVGNGATGTFTGTFTGGTTAPTVTCFYTKIGTSVTLRIRAGASFVSNANSFTITGLPAAIQPTTGGVFTNATLAEDNGVPLKSAIGQVSGSTLTLFLASAVGVYSSSGWTASGTKALSDTAFTWDVN